MFEYGSGYSTRFYAGLVNHITSVENNKGWFDIVSKQRLPNMELLYYSLDEDAQGYIKVPLPLQQSYDVIVVDGRYRNECLQIAKDCLKEGGVVVLDDSQRDRYKVGIEMMTNAGFRRLDFSGLKPVGLQIHQSTVFYRDNNCLGLVPS